MLTLRGNTLLHHSEDLILAMYICTSRSLALIQVAFIVLFAFTIYFSSLSPPNQAN
jgi:hypothetical protein